MRTLSFLFIFLASILSCTKKDVGPDEPRNQPQATFTYDNKGKGVVQFTNNSQHAESHSWDFGDGKTSTEVSPLHTYIKNGDYEITLNVKNTHGNHSVKQSVKVADLNVPVADFTFKIEIDKVTFENTSQHAATYAWDFGDNGKSTEAKPAHTYKANGKYIVKLTASNDLGIHSVSKEVEITQIKTYEETNNNLLFVANYRAGKQYLHAINASSGETKWTKDAFSGNVKGSISLVNNTLYFGDEAYFYAVDATNGNIKWRFPLPKGMNGSPVVLNNVVYFGANNNKIYALNTGNGSKKWEFNTSSAVTASPVIHNNVLYVGSLSLPDRGGIFYAINIADGNQKWQLGTYFGEMTSKAIVSGNNVYYGGSGGFHIVNSQTGDLVTHFYFKIEHSSPILVGNQLYAIVDGKELKSKNLTNENVAWSYDFGVGNTNLSSPVLVGDIIYASGNKSVFAKNRTSGGIIWQHQGVSFNAKNITYAQNVLYAVEINGANSNLVALNAKTGDVMFTKAMEGSVGDITVQDKSGKSYYSTSTGQQ